MKSVLYRNKKGNVDTYSVVSETEKLYQLDTIGWISRNDENIVEVINNNTSKQILHD